MSAFSFEGPRRQDLLDVALRQLKAKGAEDPVWESQTLLARCLGLQRLELLSAKDVSVAPEDRLKFSDWLQRYVAGEPLAYLENKAGFYGREFLVDSRVLVPRADSECVIELGMEWMASRGAGTLVDVGTGSGCLLHTILLDHPSWSGVGVDFSRDALQVAEANRKGFGLEKRCSLIQASWLVPIQKQSVDLIISNPPYIVDGEELGDGVKEFEPHLALFAPGNRAMEPYDILIEQAMHCLLPAGALLFEVGAGREPEVRALAEKAGFRHLETRKDLGGVERGILLEKTSLRDEV
ncbi:MAG: peptide chain release factor N(5)-glutamine methyltransferase [Planctomycetota bacterium]